VMHWIYIIISDFSRIRVCYSHSITYKQCRHVCIVSNSGDVGEKRELIVLHGKLDESLIAEPGGTVGPPVKGYRCRATLLQGAWARP
jgi:hypothetical protein